MVITPADLLIGIASAASVGRSIIKLPAASRAIGIIFFHRTAAVGTLRGFDEYSCYYQIDDKV